MSADRDRGIRRQKQKRAKVMKKQAREQRSLASTPASPTTESKAAHTA